MSKPERVFALYRGDEYMGGGTVKEIAEQFGLSYKYVAGMSSPSFKRRKYQKVLVPIGVKSTKKDLPSK